MSTHAVSGILHILYPPFDNNGEGSWQLIYCNLSLPPFVLVVCSLFTTMLYNLSTSNTWTRELTPIWLTYSPLVQVTHIFIHNSMYIGPRCSNDDTWSPPMSSVSDTNHRIWLWTSLESQPSSLHFLLGPRLVLQSAPYASRGEHLWTADDLSLPWCPSQTCDILFHDHNTSLYQHHVTYPTGWLIRMSAHDIDYQFNAFPDNASPIFPKENFFFPSHRDHCNVIGMHSNTYYSISVTVPTGNKLHMLVYCTNPISLLVYFFHWPSF